jgi:hypothetical protein
MPQTANRGSLLLSYGHAANTSPKVISVDRNSRGAESLEGAALLIAEGVRIMLLEGMRLYLIYLWIQCGFRLCFAFIA